jgi:hypothetical protein
MKNATLTDEEFAKKFCKHLQSSYDSLKKAEDMCPFVGGRTSPATYEQWEKVGEACDAILKSAQDIRLSSERAMGAFRGRSRGTRRKRNGRMVVRPRNSLANR